MFREHWGSSPLPPVFRHDLERLQDLLATHSWERLVELLQVFLTSDAAFIQRQGYRLGTFATSINILKAVKPKGIKPKPDAHAGLGSMGAWAKASDIAAEKIVRQEEGL